MASNQLSTQSFRRDVIAALRAIDDPWSEPEVTSVWDEVLAAFIRDAGFCGICGRPVDLAVTRGPQQPTLDHIVPLCRDGLDERANTQLAHRSCNSWKGGRDLGLGGTRGSEIEIVLDLAELLGLTGGNGEDA